MAKNNNISKEQQDLLDLSAQQPNPETTTQDYPEHVQVVESQPVVEVQQTFDPLPPFQQAQPTEVFGVSSLEGNVLTSSTETDAVLKAQAEQNDRLLKELGPNYITTTRDNTTTYFSQKAWNELGQDKAGWVQQIATPAELLNK